MKIALVTTFNEKLYEYYAHRFMSTYNWPFDCFVYYENNIDKVIDKHSYGLDGKTPFFYRNIDETNPELKAFIHRNLSRNIDSQYDKTIVPTTDYKMDAIRFSFKIFAKTHLMLDCDYDYVFWVDADTVFKKTITEQEVIDKFLPQNYCISFIDRPTYYSECGFVGYNLTKPATKRFIYNLREHYTKDLLFHEREWHDSYVWDCVRKKWLVGEPQFNLAPTVRKVGNPWPDTPMSEYADHLKGKKRKDTGVMLK